MGSALIVELGSRVVDLVEVQWVTSIWNITEFRIGINVVARLAAVSMTETAR